MKSIIDSPKISIIVPVYKAEKYLHRCVDSILTQTFTDFEVLLIDDGSPDNSGNICDGYARKDERVRVFHKENGGVSSARNLGLEHARGEWVAFIDSDDWVDNDYLDLLVEVPDGISMVRFGYSLNYSNRYFKVKLQDVGIIDRTKCMSNRCWSNFCWTFFYNRKSLLDKGLYFNTSVRFSEDRLFIANALMVQEKVWFVPKYSYHYFMNENSVVHSKRSRITFEDDLKVLISFYDNIKNDNNFNNEWHFFRKLMIESYLSVLSLNIGRFNIKKAQEVLVRTLGYINCRIELNTSEFYFLQQPLFFLIKRYFKISYGELKKYAKSILMQDK